MNTITFNRNAPLEAASSRSPSWRRISRVVLAAGVLFASQPGGLQPVPARAESPPALSVEPAAGKVTAASLGRLPRYFVENRGQVAGDAAYTFRTGGAAVHFTERGVRYDLVGPSQKESASPRGSARPPRERQVAPVSFTEEARPRSSVDISFVGARMSRPEGRDLAPTVYHFQTGPQSTWRRDVPTFERVAYRALWPGVDLVYETAGSGLKYSFEVAPGADPSLIRLAYAGVAGAQINDAGQLVVSTRAGELRDDRPFVYQEVAGARVSVESAYTLDRAPGGEHHVGFRLGAYDRARPLVIDPAVLLYSGFVGGTGADGVWAMALGPGGVAYVAGQMENIAAVDIDGFVARINPAGTMLLSMTIIGGSKIDVIRGIAVDPDGNSYIAGETRSPDLPIVNGFDDVCGGDGLCEFPFGDAFMMKLSPTGTILYSTYLGGAGLGGETAYGIAVDPQRRAVVVGFTSSDDFPTLNPLYPNLKGPEDGFVTKIDPSKSGGSSLVWSTYLGGSGNDGIYGVAIDSIGDVYVTGYAGALSTDYPLENEVHGDKQGTDVVVTVLNPLGSAFAYSSFLGGHDEEDAGGIAVGAPGVIYLAGFTGSDDSLGAAAAFPTTPGAWNTTLQGNRDGFVAKLLIGADVSVDIKDLLDPVVLTSVGGIARYKVDIKNWGPQLATGVQVPIKFDGKVEKKVVSANLTPAGIGACSIIASTWVSCSFGLLNPGDAAAVLVEVKVTKLLGGMSQPLNATASVKANEPDSKPQNNQDKETTLIKK